MGWKERLGDRIPAALAREIDIFETQIQLRRQGKLEEVLFNETRLRRGVYGQRYDNGQRHDGIETRQLDYPSGALVKGPGTLWDAPGMQRIKIPFGGLSPEQMEVLAAVAEDHADAICHVTTRQDIQLHYVHIDDTPAIMRRLAAVGITTREACGNSVRNVTACPFAGVCRDETFDVSPYAKACSRFLLGHPDAQDFGRKFKIAFSGCAENACGLVTMHDLGAIAATRVANGVERRGFEVHVGGGLGAVPYQAKLLYEFLPEEELLPTAQAISRVFARLGEKKNRQRARIKFLIAKLGVDEFRRLVEEERATLPPDPRWTAYLTERTAWEEKPLRPAAKLDDGARPEGFDAWARTNVRPQRQPGYVLATVTLPLGDITSGQMRGLAEVARRVSEGDLPDLYRELQRLRLSDAGAESIVDVTACPGTDTCKLGIASSRGLARELRVRLVAEAAALDEALRGLRIKVSGCFNSCGQHHIADLGFYGVSRKIGGTTVPHFQVILGGQWTENAASYGLAIGAVPSKRIPDVVTRITGHYLQSRGPGESFQGYTRRVGKVALKGLIEDLTRVPPYVEDRSYYSDWGDPREFTVGDMGTGECAGEVVSAWEFDMAAAERQVFEAQVDLERGDVRKADETAYRSMLQAARALVKTQFLDVPEDADRIVEEFRRRFYDTELFFDRFQAGAFAQYFFRRHAATDREFTPEGAHHLVEEAQLFIEAAYACRSRMIERAAAIVPPATEAAAPAAP
jgi:sulfite reductase (ferredoxin)